jgi:hypothetical protein
MSVLWERRDRRPSDSLLWRGLVTLVLLRVTFVWFQLACWRSLDLLGVGNICVPEGNVCVASAFAETEICGFPGPRIVNWGTRHPAKRRSFDCALAVKLREASLRMTISGSSAYVSGKTLLLPV